MASASDYLDQLKALLPSGAAFTRDAGSRLNSLLAGLAEELARVDQRGADLMVQTDPRAVTELLDDWERSWGLPDGCVTASPTPAGRRLALHQRVASLGGQSRSYFVGLSALLGYDVGVDQFEPTRLPFSVAKVILGEPWAFAWRVAVYGPVETDGPPVYASADLECVINRLKPAHTVVSFDYAPDPEPTFFFDFLNPEA
ncbi:MAG: YmfQ family protein [Brevundimonas sp.]